MEKDKKSEYVTKTSELRYRRLFETAQDGILLVDFDTGMILDVNNFLINLLGYSKTDFLEKYLWDIGIFKDIAASKENFLILREKKYVRFENLPLETKTGKDINVEFVANAYQVDDATVIQCNIRDITDRKRIEKDLENAKKAALNVYEDLLVEKEMLAAAKAKDEAMLASIGDGVVMIDMEARIVVINEAAKTMLGYPKDEKLDGRKYFESWEMQDENDTILPSEKRPLVVALTPQEPAAVSMGQNYQYVRQDKTKFPVAITIAPVLLDNKIIGAIEVFRDITKEKSIDRAKSEFVSLASHQLKTPPTAIKLLTERILSGKIGEFTAKQKEYFNDIRSSNQRMIDLVNTLLSVSRIELGTFTIQPRTADICEVLGNIVYELKPAIDNKHLKIEEACAKKESNVLIDEPLFHMVINNLIMNAVNYTPEGGLIHIESCELDAGQTLGGKTLEENSFVVSISDTGYGIPKNQQDKLFTKFFRADNAREKHVDGNGLGLYIVKSVLDHCGGLIWFISEENKGSTFYLAIPLTGMRGKAGTKQLISQ